METIQVVNLAQKFNQIQEFWQPRIAGEINESYLKLARLKGEFIWHLHEHEDELFLVIQGTLLIRLREQELVLHAGEFAIIPHGVEHLPVAQEEVQVLLLEPKTTLNTGTIHNERTVDPGWI
jgi:mannose-6-phosphate isomerase-like protein (cupin superfamily)